MRFFWLFLGLSVAVLIPFLIWGDWWETAFSLTQSRQWLISQGPWAWAAGIGLLVGDLVLPVPGTIVMSGLGWIYGWFWGGVIASIGSFLSGLVAYLLCLRFGENMAKRILGPKDYERSQALMQKHGSWWIAVTRAVPILPEVTTCLAGLTRMPWQKFCLALAAGSLPTGFLYAAIGALGNEAPGWAFALSLLLPVACWAPLRKFSKDRNSLGIK